MSSDNLLDAGTYAWIVIIGFFLVFIAVRAIETPTIVGIHLYHLSILSDAAVLQEYESCGIPNLLFLFLLMVMRTKKLFAGNNVSFTPEVVVGFFYNIRS